MTSITVYMLTSATLFGIGLYALVVRRNLVRRILAINVMGSAVFMMLIALAARSTEAGARPDPVPHALVLTGIVVAVSATALALALIRHIHAELGSPHLPEDRPEDRLG